MRTRESYSRSNNLPSRVEFQGCRERQTLLDVIATSGGYDGAQERWEHLSFLPYELLRHKWQWHLLDTLRRTLATDAMKGLVDQCYRTYPGGLMANVQKGKVPSQYQRLAS